MEPSDPRLPPPLSIYSKALPQVELYLRLGACSPDMKSILTQCQLAHPYLGGSLRLQVSGEQSIRAPIPIRIYRVSAPNPVSTNQICLRGSPSTLHREKVAVFLCT